MEAWSVLTLSWRRFIEAQPSPEVHTRRHLQGRGSVLAVERANQDRRRLNQLGTSDTLFCFSRSSSSLSMSPESGTSPSQLLRGFLFLAKIKVEYEIGKWHKSYVPHITSEILRVLLQSDDTSLTYCVQPMMKICASWLVWLVSRRSQFPWPQQATQSSRRWRVLRTRSRHSDQSWIAPSCASHRWQTSHSFPHHWPYYWRRTGLVIVPASQLVVGPQSIQRWVLEDGDEPFQMHKRHSFLLLVGKCAWWIAPDCAYKRVYNCVRGKSSKFWKQRRNTQWRQGRVLWPCRGRRQPALLGFLFEWTAATEFLPAAPSLRCW